MARPGCCWDDRRRTLLLLCSAMLQEGGGGCVMECGCCVGLSSYAAHAVWLLLLAVSTATDRPADGTGVHRAANNTPMVLRKGQGAVQEGQISLYAVGTLLQNSSVR